jgi:methionyl aminopeptidase
LIRLKNSEQLDGIRRSCSLLSALFAHIIPMVSEGVSTGELDGETRSFIEACGARSWFLGYGDYPASICVSVNEEVIHGIPGKRRLKEGDVVGLETDAVAAVLPDHAIAVDRGVREYRA